MHHKQKCPCESMKKLANHDDGQTKIKVILMHFRQYPAQVQSISHQVFDTKMKMNDDLLKATDHFPKTPNLWTQILYSCTEQDSWLPLYRYSL